MSKLLPPDEKIQHSNPTNKETGKVRHPTIDLLMRYKTVLQNAWAHRTELAGPKRMADEIAFLPAALSLQETPVHPSPRRLAWLIMALFMIALIWSIFGKVDIVAVAQGRIIVSDRTKTIQPLEVSVVKAVRVKDGDHVKAGQILVELDPTVAIADKESINEQLRAIHSEKLRTKALLQLLTNSNSIAQVTASMEPEVKSLLVAEWQDIHAKLSKLNATLQLRQAETGTVLQTIAKLEATVPMTEQRETDFKKLVDQGFVSSHAAQDKTRERVELQRDLLTQRARLVESQANAAEAERTKSSFIFETQRNLNDRYAQAVTKYNLLNADNTKAIQREHQTQLVAPVDGVIQQLAIHTVGAVVTSAQPLMIVVPDSPTVTAEVAIANQDIGFVSVGQPVEVKLETFAYTKYGTVPAVVEVVTADAVTDEKRGSYYPAILTLSKKDMLIDGKRVNLSPGMNVTAEIKTGERRIIEFLLSPVQRAGSESLRER